MSSENEKRVPKEGYQDVDSLRSNDGILAIISQRMKSGVLTVAFMREYESPIDGTMVRTQFIPEHMLSSLVEMVDTVRQRIGKLKAENKLPFKLRGQDADRR